MKKVLIAAAIFAIAGTLSNVFYINFCNFVFQCGCRSLWAGAAMACNIHAAHGKHCPWCAHEYAGYAVLALMLMAQFAITVQTSKSPWTRLAGAIVAFPTVGAVSALALGLWDGYWSA